MKKSSKTILILGSCFLLLFTSCKIRYGLNGATIPPEAKTVSVIYFQNQAPLASPLISQQFTEALKDICSSQTRLSLTNKNGDLNFEGAITSYAVTPLAIQATDNAALNRLTITVNVKYSNKFEEKKNFENAFTRYADFSSSQSLASVESDLIKQINKQLTEDIFNKAFNNW